MKLKDCPFLTDENIHADIVTFLREQGHDVLDVKEAGLVGAGDLDLIRRARAEDRVVLTHDRDFGRLVALAEEPFTGIVYLRPGHLDPAFTIGSLRTLFTEELTLRRGFLIVAHRREGHVHLRVRYFE